MTTNRSMLRILSLVAFAFVPACAGSPEREQTSQVESERLGSTQSRLVEGSGRCQQALLTYPGDIGVAFDGIPGEGAPSEIVPSSLTVIAPDQAWATCFADLYVEFNGGSGVCRYSVQNDGSWYPYTPEQLTMPAQLDYCDFPNEVGQSWPIGTVAIIAGGCHGIESVLQQVPFGSIRARIAPTRDGHACEVCAPDTGVYTLPEGSSCSDGNSCIASATCDADAVCIPQTASPAGQSCSDGDSCNGDETCDGFGTCTPGTPPGSCSSATP